MRFKRDGRGSLALPRMNAHRMVVIAAALTTLVTAMLASALAVLAGQALPSAVHHDLSTAGNTALAISGNLSSSQDAQYRALLPGQIKNALDGTPYTLYHGAWSDPLGFTGGVKPSSGNNVPIAEAAALDDVAAHAILISGRWPAAAAPGQGGAIPAALPATAAALLHVSPGDTLTFKDRDNGGLIRFQVTGLYRPSQAAGAGRQYWQLDLVGLNGATTASGFTTYGPLTVAAPAFGGALVQDQSSWVAEPRTALMPENDFSGIAGNLNGLRGSLGNPTSLPSLALTSSLPSVLSAIAANLDVARSLLAICAVLLALLAAATLLAVARLLHGQREGETAMLTARGATRGQLLRLTLAEALPLCVISAAGGGAAGIWLARALAPAGPPSGAITDAWQAAVVVGAGALIIMLVPVLSRVTPGTARVRRGRQAAISAASRGGVDLGLIVLAVITCWQLRHYSAVSAGASGAFGVDPVVVAAPALALAGGTVAALRLLPLGGKAGDRLAARGRRLTAAMANWQISRQPIRQGGAALLIVLAVATATLALTQRQSWIRSGHDQAAFAAGADVQVQTVQPLTEAQTAALVSRPGVRHAMPAASFGYAAGTGQVLAVEARDAASVALLRPDQTGKPASVLFASIRSADQAPGVALPGRPARIQFTAQLGPTSLNLGSVQVAVSVEDADGVGYQLEPAALPADGRPHALSAPVTPGASGAIYPLRITGMTVTYTLPAKSVKGSAVLTVDSVSGLPGSALGSFPANATSADLAGALQGNGVVTGSEAPSVGVTQTTGQARAVTFATGYGLGSSGIPGVPPSPLQGELVLSAVAPQSVLVMPGIATQGYLSANSTTVGSTVQAVIDGAAVGIKIVAAVPSFPTVTASSATGSSALIVDLANVQNFLTGRALAPPPVTQWWLATAGGGVPSGLAAGLPSGSALISETALADGLLNDRLSDVPQQALLGVAIAALLLASTGFCVSIAAGVQQRRAENALLAALGVMPRAAASQLCLEKFMLSLPSAVAGLALGTLLAELLVPAITLSPTASAPQPPVLIEFGWAPTLGAAVVLAVLPVLAAALVMIRRPDPAASLRAAEAA